MINAIYVLFVAVWKTEQIPETWLDSELIPVFKQRGSRTCLDNYRFLHLKDDISKLFSQIVFEKTKDKLINNMSKFQIAAKPGHRATEHLFCMMSLIQLNEIRGSAIYLCLFDIVKFFDKESVYDCQFELYKSNIRGRLYRLVFKLNENIRIRVRTPVGLTEAEDSGAGVGQGTVLGSITSSVSLDSGITEEFNDVDNENN